MSTASVIADYIRHNRSLGKRFVTAAATLSAFSRSVGNMPLRDISPAMITRFINREGTSDKTIAKKHSALKGFFRYALARGQLKHRHCRASSARVVRPPSPPTSTPKPS